MHMEAEPWLRGVDFSVHPVTAHLLKAAQQIREEVRAALIGLTREQIWARPCGMTSAGFHAKHLAGSTQRLSTYLADEQLSDEQLAAIAGESTGPESADDLIAAVDTALDRYEHLVRQLRPGDFGAVRTVGRKRLQTTAVSLAIHIAEHGQRHIGQAISAAKLSLAASSAKM